MKQLIDCRGLNCPMPVINTKKYFDTIELGVAEVIVDNEIAKNNIVKFANTNALEVSFIEEDGNFKLTLIKGEAALTLEENITDKNEKFTVVIGQDKLGNGDDALGEILIKGYIFALSEADVIPTDILFFNSGVKLAVEGSVVLDSLKALEEKNVRIQVCGTCLDFYNLKDKLAIGEISNMYSIVETMNSSDKVVNI